MTEGAPQNFTNEEIKEIVHPKPKETITGKIRRVLAATGAAVTLLGGATTASGCEYNQQATTVKVSETEPSATIDPTEMTVKVTPPVETTATPTPVETTAETTLTPEQQEEKDLQEKMTLAPDIEGATKVIKEINGLKRVTYERDGEYIGEYKKEVTQTNENGEVVEVGGIALIASEAEKILNEQLPNAKNGYLMPLAADISDLTTLGNVNLSINSEGTMATGPFFININCGSETVDLVSVLPGERSLCQSSSMSTGQETVQTELCQNSSEYIEGKEMDFISIRANFDNSEVKIIDVKMGDVLATTNEPILESDVPGDTKSLEDIRTQSFDNILKYEGVPVFVVSNN